MAHRNNQHRHQANPNYGDYTQHAQLGNPGRGRHEQQSAYQSSYGQQYGGNYADEQYPGTRQQGGYDPRSHNDSNHRYSSHGANDTRGPMQDDDFSGARGYSAEDDRRLRERRNLGLHTSGYDFPSDYGRGQGDYPRDNPRGYGRSGNWTASEYAARHNEWHRQNDPDYAQWRDEQIRGLDQDYQAYRDERYTNFSNEFSTWRKNRSDQSQTAPSATASRGDTERAGSTGTHGPSAVKSK